MMNSLVEELLEILEEQLSKKENQERFKVKVVDPLSCFILDRIFPYIFITSTIFILTFLLVIVILYLVLIK